MQGGWAFDALIAGVFAVMLWQADRRNTGRITVDRERNRNRKTSGHIEVDSPVAVMAVALLLLLIRFVLPAVLTIRTVTEDGRGEIGAEEAQDGRYYRMVDEEEAPF